MENIENQRKTNVLNKRVISTILLILAVAMVLFFTLQDAEGTTSLSEAVRQWLEGFGMKTESHALRSNVHILEYFIVEMAVLAFGVDHNWKKGHAFLCAPELL